MRDFEPESIPDLEMKRNLSVPGGAKKRFD